MKSFEAGFDSVERTAKSTKESASQIGKIATRLEKAAQKGEINAMHRELAALDASLGALRQQAANAQGAWPFQPEEEANYLLNGYLSELDQVASKKDLLKTHLQDGRLIAHPSIVRTLPPSRAVRVDKRQVSTIRPSSWLRTRKSWPGSTAPRFWKRCTTATSWLPDSKAVPRNGY